MLDKPLDVNRGQPELNDQIKIMSEVLAKKKKVNFNLINRVDLKFE